MGHGRIYTCISRYDSFIFFIDIVPSLNEYCIMLYNASPPFATIATYNSSMKAVQKFLFQHDCALVHKARSIKKWMTRHCCEWTWLACKESLPEHNKTPLGWIKTGTKSQALSTNISVWPHQCVFGKRAKIPIWTLPNLVDSVHRRAEVVIAAKGRPASYWTLWVTNRRALEFICESRQVSKYCTFGNTV